MIRLHAFFVAAVALFAAALVSVPVAPASAHTEFQDFGRYNSTGTRSPARPAAM